MKLQFEQVFFREYLRNNKANGMKNLRCFPHCCAEGHHDSGFCGSSVDVEVLVNRFVLSSYCDVEIIIVPLVTEMFVTLWIR